MISNYSQNLTTRIISSQYKRMVTPKWYERNHFHLRRRHQNGLTEALEPYAF